MKISFKIITFVVQNYIIMKKIFLAILTVGLLVACKNENKESAKTDTAQFVNFGAKISADSAITKEQLLEKYKTMKPTDTALVKVSSKIVDVCQKKGCWMNLELDKDQSAFVKFKDYAFFVPKNAAGSDVIISGKAFIEVTSINDLKEYAKDAGKSQAEIDSITAPETNYSFMADGVLIKK